MQKLDAMTLRSGPADFDAVTIRAWKLSLLAECIPVAMGLQAPASQAESDICTRMIEVSSEEIGPRDLELFQKTAQARCYELLGQRRLPTALAWARTAYIAGRHANHAWLDFFDILNLCGGFHHGDQPSERNVARSAIPRRFVQHRLETESAGLLDPRASWRIRNPLLDCRVFDAAAAQDYLLSTIGTRVAAAYTQARTPSSKSAIFSLAWLLHHGGIHAEGKEVCNASLDVLIPAASDFVIPWKAGRPSVVLPHFVATRPGNPLVARLLRHVVKGSEWMASTGNAIDEWMIYGPGGFTMTILDEWCERGDWPDNVLPCILDHDHYRAVVERSDRDTRIVAAPRDETMPRVPHVPVVRLDGIVKPEDSLFRRGDEPVQHAALFFADQVLPPGPELSIISSEPAHGAWQERQCKPALAPAAGVYWLNGLNLSGHACLWRGNDFVRLDSYLSEVAEGETNGGAWQTPWTHKVIRVIEEPVVVAFSPGYSCYGHWLVDELPRLGLLKLALGDAFRQTRFIFPKKLRPWGRDLLRFFFDIGDEQIIAFDHEREMWHLKSAIVPSFLHKNYQFQPYVRRFFSEFAPPDAVPHRKVCLSRGDWDESKPDQRIFTQRATFERMAADRGYEIIAPEELGLADQVRLMAETAIQVGEHGSAQHGSIFSRHGTIVGSINPLTAVQVNLGRIAGDRNVLLFPETVSREASGSLRFDCSHDSLRTFFSCLEELGGVPGQAAASARKPARVAEAAMPVAAL